MKKIIVLTLLSIFCLCGCDTSNETTDVVDDGDDVNVVLTQNELIGLPEHTYDISFTNPINEQPFIKISDYTLFEVTFKSTSLMSISLLKEGEGQLQIGLNRDDLETITIKSIDLEITTDEYYLEVNNTLQINLSTNVPASYSIEEEEVATVDETGLITAKSEGNFTLKVTYGEIVLEKAFSTFGRPQQINDLNRDNIFVKYHGRNVHLGSEVIMNNTASGFELSFYGTRVSANLSAWYGGWYGETRITVLVDGETNTENRVIILKRGCSNYEYELVSNLSEGLHTVKVLKITEALASSLSFHGAKTDGYFVPVNKTPKLKIEAFGDSITAGYGNLRGNSPDRNDATIQDGMQTYATFTATTLNADINVQARSGIGLYTSGNVDDSLQVNTGYKYVNYDQQYRWNLNNYIPDIVIINLGTNDHWNGSYFNEAQYKSQYIELVTNLVHAYGNKTAFIFASGLMEQKVDDYVQDVYRELKEMMSNPLYTIKFNQCSDGHPLKTEQKTASDQLVKLIRDNGLDVIHSQDKDIDIINKEIKNDDVNLRLNIELSEDYPSYAPIYLSGLNEDLLVYSQDDQIRFPYINGQSVTVKEGTYDLKFYALVDGQKYYEINQTPRHIKVTADMNAIDLKVGTLDLPIDPNPNASTYGWSMSHKLFEGYFNASSEKDLVMSNNNISAGFITRRANYGDNYTLSARISMKDFDYGTDHFGLLPYYLDETTYVWCYIGLNNATGTLRTIGFTGKLNNIDIGYLDCWSFQNLNVDINAGFDITVTRTGTTFKIDCAGNSESKNIYAANKNTNYIGVHSQTIGTITYKNITQTQIDVPNPTVWSQSTCLFEQSFETVSENKVIVNNFNNWMAGFILKNNEIEDNYTLSATIKTNKNNYLESDDAQIALVPFFHDDKNFIAVYLQWNSAGTLKSIGLTGKNNGEDIGYHDFWGYEGTPTSLINGQTLSVSRNGTNISVTFANKTYSQSFDFLLYRPSPAVGVWSHNVVATFENILVTKN